MVVFVKEKKVPEVVEEIRMAILKNPHKGIVCICINDKFSCATCYIELQYVRVWVVYYLAYLNTVIKKLQQISTSLYPVQVLSF